MKHIVTLLFLLVAGPGLLWMGLRTLRTRAWQQGVPALELLIDRAVGEEPPSRTEWDRRFARLNAGMQVLFGSFFSLVLAAVLFSLFVPE